MPWMNVSYTVEHTRYPFHGMIKAYLEGWIVLDLNGHFTDHNHSKVCYVILGTWVAGLKGSPADRTGVHSQFISIKLWIQLAMQSTYVLTDWSLQMKNCSIKEQVVKKHSRAVVLKLLGLWGQNKSTETYFVCVHIPMDSLEVLFLYGGKWVPRNKTCISIMQYITNTETFEILRRLQRRQ